MRLKRQLSVLETHSLVLLTQLQLLILHRALTQNSELQVILARPNIIINSDIMPILRPATMVHQDSALIIAGDFSHQLLLPGILQGKTSNVDFVEDLKLRAGYGITGNS